MLGLQQIIPKMMGGTKSSKNVGGIVVVKGGSQLNPTK
jgi:hypothetical protein